jgi:defect in organelle trafficking protein DotC
MPPSPANKAALLALLLLALPGIAQAQQTQSQVPARLSANMGSGPPAPSAADILQTASNVARTGGTGGADNSLAGRSFYTNSGPANLSPEELAQRLADEESPQSKAEKLAAERAYQRDLEKMLRADEGDDAEGTPPLDIADIEDMTQEAGTSGLAGVADDTATAGPLVTGLRYDAQKEAALSFGARGGLAKRMFQVTERLKAFEATLDQVFNFRALLLKAPSGLLIEPPIVRESVNALEISEGGNEAAVADRIYNINKQAKIVTAPRDWRQYLTPQWAARVAPPPRLLWPKDAAEKARWKRWLREGWRAGQKQADDMFRSYLSRLTADFDGMVRYRTMLAQGMISQPYAMHEDRGVTGDKTLLRVGDRALRLTGPSQFLTTGADLWKPADR